MSDTEKSGEPAEGVRDLPAPAPTDAPVKAETPPAETTGEAAKAPATAAPGFGSFGATRGSGLARGKRPLAPAAPAPNTAGYKPTSIEVIAPQSEYKNPFTGETTVSAPRANEPVPQAAPEPTPPAAADITPAPTAVPNPVPESSASLDASKPEEKPELKILPPEQPKRAAVGWEQPAAETNAPSNREARPTFRPDRERREGRDNREGRENREGRDNREGRENRESRENREGREGREGGYRERRDFREGRENREPRPERREERRVEPRQDQDRRPQPEPEKKSGGFVGWLKGLFGGKTEETPSTEPRRERDDGQRNRNRGGRGRGGQGGFQGERGPRPEGQQGGEPRGEGDFGGRRRRRRRGGRGRNFGDRDPRPEGQQGGGAI